MPLTAGRPQGNPASPFTALPPWVMTWRTPPALKSTDWFLNSAGPRMQPAQPLLKARKFTKGPSATSQCGAPGGPRGPDLGENIDVVILYGVAEAAHHMNGALHPCNDAFDMVGFDGGRA